MKTGFSKRGITSEEKISYLTLQFDKQRRSGAPRAERFERETNGAIKEEPKQGGLPTRLAREV
jgi:hypothetical protein